MMPCSFDYLIAGRRGGFSDTRGTLFFEVARLAAEKQPHYLLLENVPGLLSHDAGRTFQTILNTLDELGYDVAWQVLNSKDFGVPQSRNRVYIVGYLRDRCAGEVLAFNQASPSALSEIGKHPEGSRVYDSNGLSCTLAANCGGFGGKTGMYAVPVKCKTTLGYHTAYIGDSDSLAASEQAPKKSRACFVDLNENPSFTDIARCITARQDAGVGSHPRERSGVFQEIREGEHDGKFVLIVTDANGDVHHGVIRKLTPRECWRLQGFTNRKIDSAIYDRVFVGEIEGRTMEDVFRRFNTEGHPLHRGHSLSVSDIVELQEPVGNLAAGFYFCDSFGFQKVDFDPTQAQVPDNLCRILYIEPHHAPYESEIVDELSSLQRAVGGMIEFTYPFDEPKAQGHDAGAG